MTDLELAELLSLTVANATQSLEKTNAYVIFGIKYASELRNRIKAVVNLAREHWPEAGVSRSAGTDISYGQRVSRYVEITCTPKWLA